jgi:hypothetical protein
VNGELRMKEPPSLTEPHVISKQTTDSQYSPRYLLPNPEMLITTPLSSENEVRKKNSKNERGGEKRSGKMTKGKIGKTMTCLQTPSHPQYCHAEFPVIGNLLCLK